METSLHTGSCACGGVVFELTGPLAPVVACHCTQCRRSSGHFWAATPVAKDRFRLVRDDTLRWFRSSDAVERGFCAACGASLLWDPVAESIIYAAAGALDGPTGLAVAEHWFTEDAGDYYRPEGPPPPPDPAPPARLECSCLCGDVRFGLPGPAGPITACHCTRCRRLSGHYAASFDVDEATIDWQSRTGLAEYTAPGGATRGHCARCGSSLWFRGVDGAFSVEAGCVTGPTGGRLAGHIFTAAMGDYYRLDDGLPQSGDAG
jgi:hypothetical protein